MTTSSIPSCGCGAAAEQLNAVADQDQRRVLQVVLAINVALFLGEFSAGWWAGSTALQADSLDSLGDAGVYALSLYVVGRSLRWRAGAAVVKGVIQGLFGLAVLADPVMAVAASIAFVANLVCFGLLTRFRDRDINLRSVWLCSRNDLISNVGVVVAAVLVAWRGQGWPDIVVGAIVAALFLHTSYDVLRTALRQIRAPATASVRCAARGR
jgi:Co/Zn/Cd efflux system component